MNFTIQDNFNYDYFYFINFGTFVFHQNLNSMKKYFLFFITLLCIVVSCKKSSSTTSCTLSSSSIIGKYKLAAVTFEGADAISQVPECDRDNIFELKSGGIATITDTGTPMVC